MRKGRVRKSVCAQRAFFATRFFEAVGFPRFFSSVGFRIPNSVMKPVMYLAGVTSNAGFLAGLSLGAISWPSRWRTSCGDRSSIGILAPEGSVRSMLLDGAAT